MASSSRRPGAAGGIGVQPATGAPEDEPTKDYLEWATVESLSEALAERLRGQHFSAILGILRGGLVPACLLSRRLGIRPVFAASISSYQGMDRKRMHFHQFPTRRLLAGKRILVVDDVWDSGRTVMAVRRRVKAAGATAIVAVLHYKPTASLYPGEQPDFYGAESSSWIVYPWEDDPASSADTAR